MRFRSRRVWLILLLLPILLGVWMWRAASWRPKIVRVSYAGIDTLTFSPDGMRLECLSHDGMWNTLYVPSLSPIRQQQLAATIAEPVAVSDGTAVAQFFKSQHKVNVELFDASTKRIQWMHSFYDYSGGLNNWIHFSRQGNLIAISGTDRRSWKCEVWDKRTKRKQSDWMLSVGATVLGFMPATFSPDLNFAARWNSNRSIVMHDVHTGRQLWKRLVPSPLLADLQSPPLFALNGKSLLIFCDDQTRLLWDVRTGSLLHRYAAPGHLMYISVFSPDGQSLAEVGDSQIELRSITTGKVTRHFDTNLKLLSAIAFSPDSSRLAVGTSNGQVQLWRVK